MRTLFLSVLLFSCLQAGEENVISISDLKEVSRYLILDNAHIKEELALKASKNEVINNSSKSEYHVDDYDAYINEFLDDNEVSLIVKVK